jgi:Tol biopolymer transport system component
VPGLDLVRKTRHGSVVRLTRAGLRWPAALAIGTVLAAAGAPSDAVATGPVRTVSGTVTRVSLNSAGRPANGWSYATGISGHGRFVTFVSDGSNVVAGDTNRVDDVFLRDRLTGVSTRTSVSSSGAQGNGASVGGPLSADGRVSTFTSVASNLVAGDTNRVQDVFVRDRSRALTTRISVGPRGRQANGESDVPAVSADGRYVAFQSDATNLVPADTNGRLDVFVRDRARA